MWICQEINLGSNGLYSFKPKVLRTVSETDQADIADLFKTLLPKAHNSECQNLPFPLQINPFLPTGQLLAPKLIILITCLIDILFFKVLF